MASASQMHDRSSASFEEKQPGFWARDYSADHFLTPTEKRIFPYLTLVKRAASVRCLCQHCPLRLERGLSAFAKQVRRQRCKDTEWKEVKEKRFAKVGLRPQ